MPKLDEILKAKGFTDEDLKVLTPTMRETLEQHYSALETERDTLRSVNDEWKTKLDTEYQPAITKAEKVAADARLEAAKLREQVAIAKDFGYLTDENTPQNPTNPNSPNPNPSPAPFDPKQYNLLTASDAAVFAQAQGKAMAVYVDIAAEHQRLFGKPVEDFSVIYDEFLASLKRNPQATMRGTWESKYKVADRRAEITKQEQAAHDEAVQKEAVAKYISEHGGNPNLQMRTPSNQPFIPAKPAATNGLPWERGTPNQLKTQRIERANKVQAQSELVQ
jgi:hypothetical protein